jgi:hypothetical protein
MAIENKTISALNHSHNKHTNKIDHNQHQIAKKQTDNAKAAYDSNIITNECNQLRRDINKLNGEYSAT